MQFHLPQRKEHVYSHELSLRHVRQIHRHFQSWLNDVTIRSVWVATCDRLSAMGCRRTGCHFKHRRHYHGVHPHHGYCCNACRLDEGHTCNCTGYQHHAGEEPAHKRQRGATLTAVPRATRCGVAFTVPDHWACTDGPDGILQHLDWYDVHTRASGMVISPPARAAWRDLEAKLAHVNQARPLIIHVLAEDSSSPLLSKVGACINVHTRGLNAHARSMYKMGEVTGIDFDVQAVLVSQPKTAEALSDAVRFIELQDLEAFAFVCSHATHRSCGCAILLATLVYKRARIVFSTPRTRRAARERGMMEEDDVVTTFESDAAPASCERARHS